MINFRNGRYQNFRNPQRKELRRLRGENLRLEEDKAELEKRIASLQREFEETRARNPRGISTS